MPRLQAQVLLSRAPAAVLRALFALSVAFFALAASSAAWADPPGRVGRVAETSGTVWLYEDEQGEWIQARRNRPVTEGDRLSAEAGGRVEVQIGGTAVRLDSDTDLEFTQLDDARVRMRLHSGSVALRIRGGRDGDAAREFAVLTREGRYEPLRAGRYRIDARDDGSFGAALSGVLRFESDDSVLDLQSGQRAEFWSERGRTHYAWAQPAEDRFAEWVVRQDREDDRDSQRPRYVSPEMTGADDLDRYGDWDRHPEYGTIWYPHRVGADWAPYRYGHWSYLRPWGWTWVDDAPWGFAPFHYGRWVSYSGRWGWTPGQYVARPVYAPALVAWFGGGNVSVGINIGGPAVGWVPLAPREVYYPTYQVTNVYVRNVNSPYQRWHGPNPRYERTVPTGPIMYTNQGVAGGVTVVPQNVMRSRQPVSQAVLPVDTRVVSTWTRAASPQRDSVVPVPPPARVTAVPGGAVPAVPGMQRPTPWGRNPDRVGAAQGDGGDARRGSPRAQGREQRGETPPVQMAPPPMRREQGRDAGGREQVREPSGREQRREAREAREVREQERAERRVQGATPAPLPPQAPPVQPAPPAAVAMPAPPHGQPPQVQPVPPVLQPVPPVQAQQPAAPQSRGQETQSGQGDQRTGPPQQRERGAQREEREDERQQRGRGQGRINDAREQNQR